LPTSADSPVHLGPARLFPALPAEAAAQLERLGAVLAAVRPLKAKHLRDLPQAVSELSHALTDERGSGFSPDYMASPRFLTAYLSYFLPWNLYRLTRLFSGLALDLADGARITDLGSGPLTVPLALWLARPGLRGRALSFTCLDKSVGAMKAGLAIFHGLAGESPWRFHLVSGPATRLPRETADLVSAAFVLNEIAPPGRGRQAPDLERLAEQLARGLSPHSRLLVAEPGTRLAARRLSSLRHALIEHGISPLAPCTHAANCPLPGTGQSGWCHFNFDTMGAPNWLASLSAKAGLTKRNISLSFLAAAPGPIAGAPTMVRAVSEPFPLAGERYGVYGCAEPGLVLLAGTRERLPRPGEALTPAWPESPQRDAKSGAAVIEVKDEPAKRRGMTGAKPGPNAGPRPAAKAEPRAGPKKEEPVKGREAGGPKAGPKPGPKPEHKAGAKPGRAPRQGSKPGRKPARKPEKK
jgi:SAM-dependent methyltransferase